VPNSFLCIHQTSTGAVSPTHFSTSDLPVTDRFDAWHDKISVIAALTSISFKLGSIVPAAVRMTPRSRGPGDVQLLDLAQSMQTVEPASDMVCVFPPRELLQNGDADRAVGFPCGCPFHSPHAAVRRFEGDKRTRVARMTAMRRRPVVPVCRSGPFSDL
jgi:hypothetical protein